MKTESTNILLQFAGCTKIQRERFFLDVFDDIESGNQNPLQIWSALKNLELIVSEAMALAKEIVIEELTKNGGRDACFGVQFLVKEAGVKWHYDRTNDGLLTSIQSELSDVDNKLKERQTFLKNIPKEGLDLIDHTTGDCTKVYPPYKTSTTTIESKLSN